MKKLLSLILAVLMLSAVAVPAFASLVEPLADPKTCSHPSKSIVTISDDEVCVSVNSRIHRIVRVIVKQCKACGTTFGPHSQQIDQAAHNFYYHDARCDGTVQTLTMKCTECTYLTTETKTCPKAPHSGSCHWLPI